MTIAPRPPLPHRGQGVFRCEPDRAQVDPHEVVPLLLGHRRRVVRSVDARVRDDHVQTAVALDRRRHHGAELFLRRHVASVERRRARPVRRARLDLAPGVVVDVAERDRRSRPAQALHARAADAVGTAGHERDLPSSVRPTGSMSVALTALPTSRGNATVRRPTSPRTGADHVGSPRGAAARRRRTRAVSMQASRKHRSCANCTLPAMCGVGSTLGSRRNHASGGGGSGSYTSTAARISSLRTRRHNASCSTTAMRLSRRTGTRWAARRSRPRRSRRAWTASAGSRRPGRRSPTRDRRATMCCRTSSAVSSASSTKGSIRGDPATEPASRTADSAG